MLLGKTVGCFGIKKAAWGKRSLVGLDKPLGFELPLLDNTLSDIFVSTSSRAAIFKPNVAFVDLSLCRSLPSILLYKSRANSSRAAIFMPSIVLHF